MILIGGSGVALGYYTDVFSPLSQNNFVTIGSSRYYCTGDIGYFMEDGRIQIIGRKDSQLKIRGFRVEIGGIENSISQCAGVQSCAVIAEPNKHSGQEQELVAFISPDTLSRSMLMSYMRETLPHYSIPSRVFFLPALPVNNNNKIDRKVLMEQAQETHSEDLGKNVQHSIPENAMIKIWQQIFPGEEITLVSDFFSLGGHSLLCVRLITLLRKHVRNFVEGYTENIVEPDIPISMVFSYPTLKVFTEQVMNFLQESQLVLSIPAQPNTSVSSPLSDDVLSVGQQRMWFIDHAIRQTNAHHTSAYHVTDFVKIEGDNFNLDSMKNAIRKVYQRHDILRTVYNWNDGLSRPKSHVLSDSGSPVELKEYNVHSLEELQRMVQTQVQEPFDITKSVIRFSFYVDQSSLSTRCVYLLICAHHISVDAASIEIIWNEMLLAYYQHIGTSKGEILADHAHLQYAECIRSLEKDAFGKYSHQLEFWKNVYNSVYNLSLLRFNLF
jgi:hypothetical protein